MRKLSLVLGIVLLISALTAGNVEYTETIEFPELNVNGEYLEISYDDCILLGEEGAPLLPQKGIDLLLPQNEVAVGVNILDIEYYPVTENGMIQPAARPFPISLPAPANYEVIPDPAIYELDAIYPANSISEPYTGFLSGHGIATLNFCPVEYNPVTGTIRFISSISFSVETSSAARAQDAEANLKINHNIETRLQRIIENTEMLSAYHYNSNNSRTIDYDMLLITNNALAPYFADYIEFKESTGFSVAVETIEDIYSSYTGIDEAAQVRSCIISYYQSYDIEYVILGGDAGNTSETAIVPHRGFAVDDDPTLPSDMYFSNLDGTWNNDGDNYWGEQNEIDPYAEVMIGRMCVDSVSEVANTIDKHILYQNEPVIEDIEKGVMVGEELNNNPWTYGGNYKDQIADGGNYDGYYTEGFSDNFNINTFYDRDGGWNKYDLFDEFSDVGVNLINHLGHSSPTYNMKMDTGDLTVNNFTNNGLTRGFAIGYSQGCYNGSFDNWHYNGYYINEDSFAEKMVNTIPTGEVACIANSRYGWYMPGGTNSSSQYYDRMFFQGIFGEGLSEIGAVNRFSHEDNVGLMQANSNMRWVCYQTNLFGDPSLDIWTAEPTDLTITHPVSLPIGISTIQITSSTPFTRIGLVQNGTLIGRGVTDDNGLVNIDTFDPISSPGLITVSAIAHNKNRFLGNIIIVTDQPYVVLQSIGIDDAAGNNNNQIDYAESVNLDLILNNVGNQLASGVTATITTFDQNVAITDNSVDCGDINGETVIELAAAFALEIEPDVEDQHEAVFQLIIEDDEGTEWTTTFRLTLNAPVLECGYPVVDDSAGNDDGVLDAGETVILSIPTANIGNSDSEDLLAVLLSFDPWVTVNTATAISEPLEPGMQGNFDFEITIAPETPEGTSVSFMFSVSAGEYEASGNYSLTVGLVLEDFETGDFNSYPWTFTGQEWTISNNAYMGQNSARSASIGDNTITAMVLETWVRAAGEISFYKKVSCEADPQNHNYDWLAFYIDGSQRDRWDGEDPWSLETYNVTEGLHTFEWRYRKDQAVASGSDAGWIDYIVFPPMGPPPAPELALNLEAIDLELLPESETTETLTLENLGVGEINYSVQVIDTSAERDLEGSYLSCNTGSYTPGETTGWVFELLNDSPDAEEIVEVVLDFPEGITVNIATGFYGGSNPLMPDNASGNGAVIHWTADPGLLAGEDATAGINLTVAPDFTGEVQLNYDLLGSDGSLESGSIYLFSLGIGWCNLSHNTGTLNTFEEDDVIIYFNSAGLSYGTYTADIIVSDERNTFTIPVALSVLNTPTSDGEILELTEFIGAYPNPFNPDTNLKFKLAQSCNIKLDIFNIRGQLVSSLVNGTYQTGEHNVHWNGKDIYGNQAATGVYFCKFTAQSIDGRPDGNSGEPTDYTTVTKIALMK
ncbi:MAG: T9SS type A sorting domain-containing protein [Candidatus Cloacimonetes bacterium]|nr:T9SS type A sorting domain-containing protein [Candidatus Cloacimonadota bacterium]